MTCANCARHVSDAINAVPGVRSGVVDLEAQQGTIRWQDGSEPDVEALLRAIDEAGYKGQVIENAPATEPSRFSGWTLNLLLGIPATAVLMIGEWVLRLGMAQWFQWVAFALGTIVQFLAGWRFYRGAWLQLKARSANMDTLVALGSTTAYGYSAWVLFSGHGGHVYFMESTAIITLISVGHWLESRMSARASDALRNLLDLAPAMARHIDGGSETLVPVAKIAPGDMVALLPGDKAPTDGTVVEGHCFADESMLTGESTPVGKSAGDSLFAGTLNQDGRVTMRVSAVGEETALAHIVAAVQRAQSSRASIQRLGDRVSAVFVPVVVTVALAAGAWWGLAPESAGRAHGVLAQFLWPAHVPAGTAAGFIIAAAVLIVACPCAMGLATPVAIMAGSNAAARKGILIRDGVALEKAGRVTAVLFDKTGTLTHGKPSVDQTWVSPGGDLEEARETASALAKNSTHPISQALAAERGEAASISEWREVRGAGVEGRSLNGDTLRLGSMKWLGDSGVDCRPGEKSVADWTAQGATVTGLARGTALQALFAVRDTIKPGAQAVVESLIKQGLGVYMVTGDNAQTAAAVARQAGIEAGKVFAEIRPENKAGLVKRLQEQGQRVAFVGDGINDAPALEQADLGIAVSRASDIAREAADIILLRSEIEAVPESLGLAKATLRTIKQNLFWAFFYNSVGVPLAALGFMSPILCAAAMGISDVVVIGNALRLRRAFKVHTPSEGAIMH